jgi:hypothetical protein
MFSRPSHAVAKEFKRLFNANIWDYWEPLFGFDVVKFDDNVVQSGDGCMADVTREKFGQEGEDYLEKILNNEIEQVYFMQQEEED